MPLEGDFSLEQAERFRDMIIKQDWRIGTLKLSGGEPLLHPDIAAMVDLFATIPRQNVHRIRILTNGTTRKISVSGHVAYWESPLEEKHHVPVLISPADLLAIGVYGNHRSCPLWRKCGACLDCYGFTPCPPAGSFGHALGINPYSPKLCQKGYPPICRHCFLSLGATVRQAVQRMVASGEIQHPSPTYREGLEQLRHNRTPFPRW